MLTLKQTNIIVLFLCFCCVEPMELNNLNSDENDARYPNDRVPSATTAVSMRQLDIAYGSQISEPMDSTGFCTRHRDMKLMCYCTPEEKHEPVKKAECWVFSDNLLQNDTTWTRFYQQLRLRELKIVVQNHGRLDYLPTMIIAPMKNLSRVSIEYSQVEIVSSYAFASLDNLESIILSNNQIIKLSQYAFTNHLRLRDLVLDHNHINYIDTQAFQNLPQCANLLLNNNNISNLYEGIFAEMARLLQLNLAHNHLTILTSALFLGLGNLNLLNLSHNDLNFVGDNMFIELWSLAELELNDNHIHILSERALNGLNNLKSINLRNNNLKNIDIGLFRPTPALLILNAEYNQLETITSHAFQPIMDNLINSTSELLLAENKLKCDCRLQWLFELKNHTHYQQLSDSLEEIMCILKEPKLSAFAEPVPNYILDLLNIGGRRVYSSRILSSLSDTEMLSAEKEYMHKSRQIKEPLVAGDAELLTHVGVLAKRSLQNEDIPRNIYDNFDRNHNSNFEKSNLHADYFVQGMLSEQLDMEEDLNLMKQNQILSQNDEAISNILDDVEMKAFGGIRVRLFLLKPENLVCPIELNETTEFPESRGIGDLHNNEQSNSCIGALRRPIIVIAVIMALYDIGVKIIRNSYALGRCHF